MAEWDTSYINDLPDSAFLLIEPGGHKDREGKTVPRTLRHFVVRNAAGNVDDPHLRNALARIPQASSLSPGQRETAMSKAKGLARQHPTIGGPSGTYEGEAGSGRSALPATGLEVRSFEVDLELRGGIDGRTLVGRAVPYGVTVDVGAYRERFVAGAFAEQIKGGQLHTVHLYASHRRRIEGDLPLAKTSALEERSDGAWGEWRLPHTTDADNALELFRSGTVSGLSIGFKSPQGGSVKGADGVIERRRAHLDHVVLTPHPVYADAGVVSVRSAPDLTAWREAKAILDEGALGAR
jgi:HK97 family phage prohead protease